MTQPSINLIQITESESDIVSVCTVQTIINETTRYKEVVVFSIIRTKQVRVFHIQYGKVIKERNVTPSELKDIQPLLCDTILT